MKKTYIGISRDHSLSMRSVARAAARDYNTTISVVREQATEHQIDTIVSVVRCGDFNDIAQTGVVTEAVNSSVFVLQPINEAQYRADGRSTPLYDSVGALIEQLERVPDVNSPDASFLVMIITDGEENSSHKWSAHSLSNKINALQRTGRWSFIFRVPPGYSSRIARQLLIPSGNIIEWELTERGMEQSTKATTEAFANYYRAQAQGERATTKFFTNLGEVSVEDIKKNLKDVSAEVSLWLTSKKEVVREYCEAQSRAPFIKGAAFYQLTKAEREVQDYKMIAIRDKVSGAVYSGAAARSLLGLPATGTTAVVPGDHGQYDIYIQSTSVNRVLPPGTQVLYWPYYNQPQSRLAVTTPLKSPYAGVQQAKQVKATPVPKPAAPTAAASAEFIAGYKIGFETGKQKLEQQMKLLAEVKNPNQYQLGFLKGYKDGRGKQKRLYK